MKAIAEPKVSLGRRSCIRIAPRVIGAPWAQPRERHLFAAYNLGEDKLYEHVKATKNRTKFLEFCRYLRSLYSADVRIAIVRDNFSPHLTTSKVPTGRSVGEANNVEFAYIPTNSPWLNRDRGAVHRVAVLRARRHRPRKSPHAGVDDPP
ncbi:transposase [Rhodococcus sp. AB351]|uniref:transposase n=1 Tax=Rhodococcus sp. AB351 TaxID=3413280 RepID=UPI003C264976